MVIGHSQGPFNRLLMAEYCLTRRTRPDPEQPLGLVKH
jgi:hypothetical protein